MVICYLCDKPIRDGAEVQAAIRCSYKGLKSDVVHALDKSDMVVVPNSVVHADCIDEAVMDVEDTISG